GAAKDLGREQGSEVIKTNLEDKNIFKDLFEEHGDDPEAILEDLQGGFMDSFTQYAKYSNHILPELRSLAGFEDDTGVGTYTYARSEGVVFDLDEIADKFWEGVFEVMEEDMEKHYKKYKELSTQEE
ncbi:unnamed protein product, partial [marine sediment metagenome]